MKTIGYIVCALGLVYVAAGLYKLLNPPQPPPGDTAGGAQGLEASPLAEAADVLLALAKLVTALTKAPEWLAACVLGVLLILVGYWLIRQGLRRSPSRTEFGE